MTAWFVWLLVGVGSAGLLIIWFITVHRELARAKQSVANAIRQVRLHIDGRAQVSGGPYEAAAANSLSISRSIYHESVKNYEAALYKPVNRIPALLLGYSAIQKTDGS